MPLLEVTFLSGDTTAHELSKNEPISIGRHASSDIRVNEEGVAALHCRVAWNRKAFEVTAATPDGVEVNGTLVTHAVLSPGDVIRVGTVDITFRSSSDAEQAVKEPLPLAAEPASRSPRESEEIALRPITEEQIPSSPSGRRADPPLTEPVPPASRKKGAKPSAKGRRPKSPEPPVPPPVEFPRDDGPAEHDRGVLSELFEPDFQPDDETESEEDLADRPVLKRSSRFAQAEAAKPAESAPEEADSGASASLAETVRERLGVRPVRPGEQDVIRSPLILLLGGGALVLLLVAATFWFVIGRQGAEQQFQAAMTALDEQQFDQAIQMFQEFLQRYPNHKLADEAYVARDKARILQHISGATPDWEQGLAVLKEFMRRHRDDENYDDQRPTLQGYARKIADGARQQAETAESVDVEIRKNLLELAREAQRLAETVNPDDPLDDEMRAEWEAGVARAEAAILRRETYNQQLAEIDAAIRDKRPIDALALRVALLERYSDFADDKQLEERRLQALEVEKSLVAVEALDQAAVTDALPAAPSAVLTLVDRSRLRTGIPSEGRVIYALAGGSLFALDTITGEPVWRRDVGSALPFAPIEVSAPVEGWLVFDAHRHELTVVERKTGKSIWRQRIEGEVTGAPAVHEGQILLTTDGGHLLRIDLASGRITGRVTFSQPILGTPAVLRGGEQVALAGRQSVLYVLSLRPLACLSVTYTQHKAGSVVAPLTAMGSLLLLAENDRRDRCRLRIFDTRRADEELVEREGASVEGHVRDAPALWGNRLFVPVSGERVFAFTVSDDPEQRALTPVAPSPPVRDGGKGPIYLVPGPEGELWMAGSKLRRFRMTTEAVVPEQLRIAQDEIAQPLQLTRRFLFVGNRKKFSDATFMIRVDRESLASEWSTVLGARLTYLAGDEAGSCLCINDAGSVFRVTSEQLDAGGFQLEPAVRFELPDGLADPPQTAPLGDGRAAFVVGEPGPRLWIVNGRAQIERELTLAEPVQAPPAPLAGGVLVAMKGRLRLEARRGSTSFVEDYVVEQGEGEPPRWAFLVPVEENVAAAIDEHGRIVRIEYRTSPRPYLAEAGRLDLGQPVDVAPVRIGRWLVVADAVGRLHVLDATTPTLESLAELQLPAPAVQPLWQSGSNLFLQTGEQRLLCFDVTPELQEKWSLPLGETAVAGTPLVVGSQVLLALQDGDLLRIDLEKGTIAQRTPLGQPLVSGPIRAGKKAVIATLDGSVLRIELPEEAP